MIGYWEENASFVYSYYFRNQIILIYLFTVQVQDVEELIDIADFNPV